MSVGVCVGVFAVVAKPDGEVLGEGAGGPRVG